MAVFLFAVHVSSVKAQTNFTGNWELDKAKSKLDEPDGSFNGRRILHISQNALIITMSETYIQPGAENYNSEKDTLYLDGKTRTEKVFDEIRKISTSWSQDKRTLIHKDIGKSTLNPSDSTVMSESFKLSDDNLTLTIDIHGKNSTREIKSTEVYNKK